MHFGYPGQNAVPVREKFPKPFEYNIGTPLFGAHVKYTGFQGRIPCLDAQMVMWTQSAYLAKDWARSVKRIKEDKNITGGIEND